MRIKRGSKVKIRQKAHMHSSERKWNEMFKLAVWKKGLINPDHSPDAIRSDAHGNLMMWSEYENEDSEFGWKIEHIHPELEENTDHIENLQPLQMRLKND